MLKERTGGGELGIAARRRSRQLYVVRKLLVLGERDRIRHGLKKREGVVKSHDTLDLARLVEQSSTPGTISNIRQLVVIYSFDRVIDNCNALN